MFLGPSDTTGITQLLDQMNQLLHSEYRLRKDETFSNEMTVDREGFMNILGDVWEKWSSTNFNETIRKTAKVVGVSKDGVKVDLMNQEKFQKAELIIEKDDQDSRKQDASSSSTFSSSDAGTPEKIRKKGSILNINRKRQKRRMNA